MGQQISFDTPLKKGLILTQQNPKARFGALQKVKRRPRFPAGRFSWAVTWINQIFTPTTRPFERITALKPAILTWRPRSGPSSARLRISALSVHERNLDSSFS